MTRSLIELLFASARGDAVALRTSTKTYRYDQLWAETGRWAHALQALGVRPGDRVAVQVEKSSANLILYLATLRAGAVYLPLNPAYTFAELSYFIGDAEPVLLVCDPAARAALTSQFEQVRVESLDAAGRGTMADAAGMAQETFATIPRGADDLAAICYTSGTTGRSKGALLTQRALISNALTLKELWRFSADDVLIHALPIYHVHGLFVATNVTLMAGASMIFQAKFEPQSVLAALPEATVLMGIPTFYTRLLPQPTLTREATSTMRLFVSGSAPLLEATHRAFEARTGHAILERYGMTETGMNASNPYEGPRRPGTVGMALPDVSLRIVDSTTGAPLATGGVGVIEVKGPNVCSGYWRNPEKTAEAFRDDGYFITGDLGMIDDAGYLSIVGRDKDLIITGGLNVYPKEVEAEIDGAPGVVESAVIGLPHEDFGEAVTAVVAFGAKQDSQLHEAAILDYLAPRLARFKQPKRVIFVPDLPRNAMGKVQKSKLRETWRNLYDA